MTERDAFIRSICEVPEDDTRRLAFADWLAENGEADRARLIRMQCLRDRYAPPRVSVRRWFAPWWSGPSSYSFHNPQWDLIAYPRRKNLTAPQPRACLYVRRGFVDSVCLPLVVFLHDAESLFRTHPVAAVSLTDREPFPTYDRHEFSWTATPERDVLEDRRASCIPRAVLALLVGGESHQIAPDALRFYPTPEAARGALSRGCVAYGRSLAGLDPLPAAARAAA
jgi:uncharacterized protein (TIGR02996 family)